MRITSKGQVTIPQAVREEAGLRPGTEVDILIEDGTVKLVKATGEGVERVLKAAARARKTAQIDMNTEDFMRLVRGEWPYQGP